jgi:hypothetical protein
MNPQYKLTLPAKAEVTILLEQEDGRLHSGTCYPYEDIHRTYYMVLVRGGQRLTKFNNKDMVSISTRVISKRETSFELLPL